MKPAEVSVSWHILLIESLMRTFFSPRPAIVNLIELLLAAACVVSINVWKEHTKGHSMEVTTHDGRYSSTSHTRGPAGEMGGPVCGCVKGRGYDHVTSCF